MPIPWATSGGEGAEISAPLVGGEGGMGGHLEEEGEGVEVEGGEVEDGEVE